MSGAETRRVFAVTPIGLDRSGTHLRQGGDRTGERKVDLTSYQVLNRRSAATIRHERKARARLSLEEQAGDMPWVACAEETCVALSGLALQRAVCI
jgi:hypothetical protein